jgi:glycosyltransferase involved in cell wall biosynthesis
MKEKLVSICIPTYNSEFFLEGTLASILGQSYQNIEIIIGDNCSSDKTIQIIENYAKKDFRISYYKNEFNIGYSKNCNKLISKSNGDYICIYHSDDIYHSNIIEKQVNFLNHYDEISGVFTHYNRINEFGEIIEKTKFQIQSIEQVIIVNLDEFIKIVLLKGGSCFCCPTSMIRREVYSFLNCYDESLKYIEDQDMWARILLNGSLAILNEKLINYRIHNKQWSSIYLDIERKEEALPLKHIKNFIFKYNLKPKFNNEILIAEAKDFVYLAVMAVRRNDYPFFYQSIMKSKLKYGLEYKTREGFVQNFPSLRITYSLIKGLYIFKKFLK